MRNFDTRDAEEHEAVCSIFAGLPVDHPARIAYVDGASTIELTHLVDDQTLCEQLNPACLARHGRIMDRAGHFRP
jgi:hypothetical protein